MSVREVKDSSHGSTGVESRLASVLSVSVPQRYEVRANTDMFARLVKAWRGTPSEEKKEEVLSVERNKRVAKRTVEELERMSVRDLEAEKKLIDSHIRMREQERAKLVRRGLARSNFFVGNHALVMMLAPELEMDVDETKKLRWYFRATTPGNTPVELETEPRYVEEEYEYLFGEEQAHWNSVSTGLVEEEILESVLDDLHVGFYPHQYGQLGSRRAPIKWDLMETFRFQHRDGSYHYSDGLDDVTNYEQGRTILDEALKGTQLPGINAYTRAVSYSLSTEDDDEDSMVHTFQDSPEERYLVSKSHADLVIAFDLAPSSDNHVPTLPPVYAHSDRHEAWTLSNIRIISIGPFDISLLSS